jgi:hypothetical protein
VQVKKTKTHFEVSIPVFSKKTTPSTHWNQEKCSY